MKNEIAELNQLNAKIQRNAIAQKRAERSRQEEAKSERIDAALMACRIPVALASATWIAVSMGLATTTLAAIVTAPCLLWVCYQAGTVR